MSHRLAAAVLCAALAACSAPTGKTCSQASDCGTGHVCSAGYCQVAIDTTIASGPALAVANPAATFQFTSTPPGASFECSLDGTAFVPCSASFSLGGLADGPHTLDVRARSAENVDATPATWAWTVDTTPPDTTIDGGPTGTVVGAVSLTFSSPEAGATFECSLDLGAWAACTSPYALASPALGGHTLRVRAKDALGNADASPAERSWSTAADTTITAHPAALVASRDAAFGFTASDVAATFECSLDGAAFTACNTGQTYTLLLDGTHTFQVRATGGGAVDPSPASYTWAVDTTGPVVTLTSAPASSQSEDPVFTFSSEAGATFECQLDALAWTPCTSPWTLTVPIGVDVGMHSFHVRGRDALGNLSANPASCSWTQQPETAITWAPLPWTNRTAEKVAFASTTPGATFQCQLDGGGYSTCNSPHQLSTLGNGQHTVDVRAVSSTFVDPTPATTTFSVSTSNALVSYNFEGLNGTPITSTPNTGQLAGYTASGSGAAAFSSSFSHGATGLSSASFTAQEGSPPTNRGSVTLTGVRKVLQHDLDPTDGAYTIAFWYSEHTPANTMSTTSGLSPTIFDTRNAAAPGGGFHIYHGVGTTQPPPWGLCWSSNPTNQGCAWQATGSPTGTAHRMVIESAYNGSGYDITVYIDGTAVITASSAAGQVIFNSLQYDPVIGGDWWGYIDDLRIWNRTFGGTPP